MKRKKNFSRGRNKNFHGRREIFHKSFLFYFLRFQESKLFAADFAVLKKKD